MDYYDLGRLYKEASEESETFIDFYDEYKRACEETFEDTFDEMLEREYHSEWTEE